MTADLFAPYQELAAALLPHALPQPTGKADGSHDLAHLARVWRNVRTIAARDGGDAELLAAATLLHDCVAVEKDSPLRAQASRLAAARASDILEKMGWGTERVADVAHAIEAHSFSAGIVPQTREAQVLQDADRLDAIGAIGVARCFYTGGRLGSGLYDPADIDAHDRDLDDARYALDHFESKLLKLASGFHTMTGAAMAEARHKRMQDYLAGLREEIG